MFQSHGLSAGEVRGGDRGEWGLNLRAGPYADTYVDSDSYSHGNSHGHEYPDPYRNPYADRDRDQYANTEPHANSATVFRGRPVY